MDKEMQQFQDDLMEAVRDMKAGRAASEVPALVKFQAEHSVKTRCHIELESRQVAEIQQAVAEADGDEFATDDEFNAVVKKHAG